MNWEYDEEGAYLESTDPDDFSGPLALMDPITDEDEDE